MLLTLIKSYMIGLIFVNSKYDRKAARCTDHAGRETPVVDGGLSRDPCGHRIPWTVAVMGRMAPGGSFARGGEAGYVSGVGSVVGGLMVVGGGLRVEGGPVVRVVRVVGGSMLVEVEPPRVRCGPWCLRWAAWLRWWNCGGGWFYRVRAAKSVVPGDGVVEQSWKVGPG